MALFFAPHTPEGTSLDRERSPGGRRRLPTVLERLLSLQRNAKRLREEQEVPQLLREAPTAGVGDKHSASAAHKGESRTSASSSTTKPKERHLREEKEEKNNS
eukprot:GHVS01000948.1.p4 GENE.GHVS01000948.1~~GHVS01000948.1.p4  ORF type:complete len:103 (-),score=27.84 GHVS01000948.1:1599-1907(-)